MKDLDGVPWFQAPLPACWHRCRPQTRGTREGMGEVMWCACGALRLSTERWWRGKNWRRRNPGPQSPATVPE